MNNPITYTIVISNIGPFDAEEQVTIVDTLPNSNTYVGYIPDPRGTDCTEDPVGTVTCLMPNLDQDPGPTNSATVILQTLAPSVPGPITNTVRVYCLKDRLVEYLVLCHLLSNVLQRK